MALDLNKVQQRLAQLQSKGKKKGDGTYEKTDYTKFFWKPSLGETSVRLVPFKNSPDFPLVTVFYHNNIVKFKIIALNNFGEKDPIVEFSNKLKDSKDKDDRDLGYKLRPKAKTYAQVLVRGEENKGVRLWEFGTPVEGELLKYLKKYGDMTEVNEGYDITVEGTDDSFVQNGKVIKFIKPSLTADRESSPLSEDEDFINKCLEDQHDPLNLPFNKKYSYQEILGFLEKWLNPEGEEVAEEPAAAPEPEPIGDEEGDILDVNSDEDTEADTEEDAIEEPAEEDPIEELPFIPDPVTKPKNALAAASKRIVAKNNEEIQAAAKKPLTLAVKEAVAAKSAAVKKTINVAATSPTISKVKTVPTTSNIVTTPAKVAASSTPTKIPGAGAVSNKAKFDALFPKK